MAATPAPNDPTKATLSALEASFNLLSSTTLVDPADNEKKIKAALKEAKKLLKELRGQSEPESPTEDTTDVAPEDTPADNGVRAYAANANVTPDQQRQIDLAEEQFKQSVTRVDNQILAQYIQAVQSGSYEAAEAILANYVNSAQIATLAFALLTISAILLPIYMRQRMQNLYVQFGLHTVAVKTDSSDKAIKEQAQKGAESHVHTIAKDLKNSLDDAIHEELPTVRESMEERFPALKGKEQKDYINEVSNDKKMYQYARQLILSGASKETVINKLTAKFADVSKRRAGVIAHNEANRIFTLSQFEADEQFLAQNELTDKAYKRLVSNTGHPCPICDAIIQKTRNQPIPFKQDFIKFGKEMKVKTESGKTMKFTPDFEHIRGGHIHVNCHCRYELLIKQDDGSFFNSNTGVTMNALDFTEELHPRDHKGKFAKKASPKTIEFSKIGDVKEFDSMIEDAYWTGQFGSYDQQTTEAVRAYQGHYYDAINMHLRGGSEDKPLHVYGEDTTYNKTVSKINSAANITLSHDTILYRGTEHPYHRNNDVGETIHSRSFLSTSVDRKVSEDFKHKDGSMLVITAKKGQKVVLPDLVTFGKRGRTMGEAEVLMPTGSSLKITRIDGDVVYAELN